MLNFTADTPDAQKAIDYAAITTNLE